MEFSVKRRSKADDESSHLNVESDEQWMSAPKLEAKGRLLAARAWEVKEISGS